MNLLLVLLGIAVLYTGISWLQRPENISIYRELVTFRRPHLRMKGHSRQAIFWQGLTYFRWGLLAIAGYLSLEALSQMLSWLDRDRFAFLLLQGSFGWLALFGMGSGFYRLYALCCWQLEDVMVPLLYRLLASQPIFSRSPGIVGPRGGDRRIDLWLSVREATLGTKRRLHVERWQRCFQCQGSGQRGWRPHSCSTCVGSGRVDAHFPKSPTLSVEMVCSSCNGLGLVFSDSCINCQGKGQTLESREITVHVPAAVWEGVRLSIAELGDDGRRGTPPGDLYIYLFVNDD